MGEHWFEQGGAWPRCHSLKISILALQVLVFLFKLFPLRPHAKYLLPGDFCDAINDSGMEVGTTFPRFAVSAQDGILCAQLRDFGFVLRGRWQWILNLIEVYPA